MLCKFDIQVMRTKEIVILFVNMACIRVTILQFNAVRYALKFKTMQFAGRHNYSINLTSKGLIQWSDM